MVAVVAARAARSTALDIAGLDGTCPPGRSGSSRGRPEPGDAARCSWLGDVRRGPTRRLALSCPDQFRAQRAGDEIHSSPSVVGVLELATRPARMRRVAGEFSLQARRDRWDGCCTSAPGPLSAAWPWHGRAPWLDPLAHALIRPRTSGSGCRESCHVVLQRTSRAISPPHRTRSTRVACRGRYCTEIRTTSSTNRAGKPLELAQNRAYSGKEWSAYG